MLTRRFFPIKTPELVNSASNHEQTSANPYFQNTPGRYANYSRGLIKFKQFSKGDTLRFMKCSRKKKF